MILACCCIFSVSACDANGNTESEQNSESNQYSEGKQNGGNAQESIYSSVMCSHIYTSTITMEPTCGKAGIKTYTCRFCNDSYTEEIAKLTTHSYTWEITVNPTTTSTGVRTYTCSVCGDTYTETLAILPAIEYGEPVESSEGGKSTFCSVFLNETCIFYNKFAKAKFDIYVSANTFNKSNSSFHFYVKICDSNNVVLASKYEFTPILGPGQSTNMQVMISFNSPLESGKTYKATLVGCLY